MANPATLRPISLNHEEAVACGRKGGKASAEARRKRKTLAETLEIAMNLPVPEEFGDIRELGRKMSKHPKNIPDNTTGWIAAVTRELYSVERDKCERYDRMKAAELIRDQLGENPDKITDQTSCVMLQFAEAMRAGMDIGTSKKDDDNGGHIDDMEA